MDDNEMLAYITRILDEGIEIHPHSPAHELLSKRVKEKNKPPQVKIFLEGSWYSFKLKKD